MNDAHLHMVVNHFPIIGVIFGLILLITSIVLKNNTLRITAYSIFIFIALFAFASMFTGEGAEEIAEKLPNVTDEVIHEHEELAEQLAMTLYVLAAISILGLYTTVKKHSKAKLISFLALVVSLVGCILAKSVGTSGGEIRHTEIRQDANKLINQNESSDNFQGKDE